MTKRPAIFLDRDGTIIEDVGYIKNPSGIIFYPDIIKALTLLKDHFLFFIITNQSGISKGFLSQSEANSVNDYIVKVLKAEEIVIEEVFCCPHQDSDHCNCKKPNPYFINQAVERYNIRTEDSYIIGDHPSDVFCGLNAQINPVYLLTGHGEKHRDELLYPVKVCTNILEAARFINSQIT